MGANPPPFAEFLKESEAPPTGPPPFSAFLESEAKAPSIPAAKQETPATAAKKTNGMTIGPARDRGIMERIGDVVEPITSLFSGVTPDPNLAPLAKDAGQPKPLLKFSEFLDQGAAPTLPQPIVVPGAMGGVPAAPNPELLRGAERGALESAESLTTPENLALMAATAGGGALGAPGQAAGKAAGGAFSASMVKAMSESAPEAYAAWQRGNYEEAARLAMQTLATGVMAGGGAKHVAEGKPRIMEQPLTALEAEGVRKNVPETGKALKRAAGKATDDPILQEQLDQLVEEHKAKSAPADNQKPGQAAPKQSQKQRRAAIEPEESAFEPGDPAGGAKGAKSESIPADRETKAPVAETIPPPGETAATAEPVVSEPVAAPESGLTEIDKLDPVEEARSRISERLSSERGSLPLSGKAQSGVKTPTGKTVKVIRFQRTPGIPEIGEEHGGTFYHENNAAARTDNPFYGEAKTRTSSGGEHKIETTLELKNPLRIKHKELDPIGEAVVREIAKRRGFDFADIQQAMLNPEGAWSEIVGEGLGLAPDVVEAALKRGHQISYDGGGLDPLAVELLRANGHDAAIQVGGGKSALREVLHVPERPGLTAGDRLKSERGSFSNKPAEGPSLLEDLITVGRAEYQRVKGQFSQFRQALIDTWGDHIKPYIVGAWQRLRTEERGSLEIPNPAAKSAPPAPPAAKKLAVGEETPPSDRVKTSPSYDKTKGKILEKIAVSDDTKAAMADAMGKWEATNPERQVVGFSDIVAEARALDPKLIAELKVPKAGETLNPAVRFAARETLNGIQDELVAKRKQLSELTADATPDERAKLERQAESLDIDAQRLLDVLIPTRSQDGRNLAYHRMMAEKSFDPTYWLSRARSKAGGVLPDKVREDIEGILAEGREAEREAGKPATPRTNRRTTERRTGVEPAQPEARPKSEIDSDPAVQAARRKLAKKMVEVEKSTIWETISALRKAGLLTGAKTHMRNLGGNASFQVLEEVRRVPSAAADIALSLFSGQRTVMGPDFGALRDASKAAATKGWREAKETWADGATREQLEQFDTARELNSGWGPMVRIPFTNESRPLVDAYVNQTFRLLGAEDRLFKAFAFERSIKEQMKVSKKNGKPVDAPTATMIAQAMGDAEVATFNNANLAADAVTGARQKLRQADTTAGRAALFGFDTVIPFVKTPTNIIARVIEYSGGGLVSGSARAAQSMVKKSLTPEQQRAISISFGRGATGLGLVYMGYQLAANGLMTGGRSDDPGRRNAEEAAGRSAGAILVDGKWRQVGSFSPAGNLLVIGATLQREAEKPLKDELKRPAGLAAVATKTVLDQPLLTGAREVVDALQNPAQQGERAVTSTAGSFVPTFLNDIGSLFDGVRRDSRGESFAEGIRNAVKARLPGMRNTLPARTDVLGREQKQERTAAIDPTLSQAAKTDAVSRELVETKASLSGLKKKNGENAFAFRARSIAEGKMVEAAIRQLLADRDYKAEAPDTRREIITKTISGLRSQIGRNILNTEQYQKMAPSQQVKMWQDMASGN